MAIYTVYEPPLRSADARHADRFVFVRDGFFWSAFLLAPLWMLRHRLWLALLLYVAVAVAIGAGAQFFRLSAGTTAAIAFLMSLLIGFEASTLRRWALARRKWTNVGVVVGDDLELAERRFFDAWIRHELPSRGARPNPVPSMRSPAQDDVIGLFPQPGGRP
ncbi:MAG: DUF2628 domain-containing protein [Alphaproteobacteria bacterium]|nr:MAG: DUF2628 domain-containing protein [Alphaproteobacteria bacterium]